MMSCGRSQDFKAKWQLLLDVRSQNTATRKVSQTPLCLRILGELAKTRYYLDVYSTAVQEGRKNVHRQVLSLVDSAAGGQEYSSIIPGVTGHESRGRRQRERP